MNLQVSNSVMASFIVSAVLGLCLTIAVFIFMRKKFDAKIKPFFVGCITFVLFVSLEGLCNSLLFKSSAGGVIQSKTFLFALVGGIQAGLFEEMGRFFAFKCILNKSKDEDSTALMYGAGHGGIEVIVVFVVSMITNLVLSLLINNGMTSVITSSLPAEQLPIMQQQFEKLAGTKAYENYLGVFERFTAILFHIANSVVVWIACKDKKNIFYLFIAVFAHALFDFLAVIFVKNNVNAFLLEFILFAFSALYCGLVYFLSKKNGLCFSNKTVEKAEEI